MPGERYLVAPSTRYQVPNRPGTQYQVSDTRYPLPVTWYPFGTRHMASGTDYLYLNMCSEGLNACSRYLNSCSFSVNTVRCQPWCWRADLEFISCACTYGCLHTVPPMRRWTLLLSVCLGLLPLGILCRRHQRRLQSFVHTRSRKVIRSIFFQDTTHHQQFIV